MRPVPSELLSALLAVLLVGCTNIPTPPPQGGLSIDTVVADDSLHLLSFNTWLLGSPGSVSPGIRRKTLVSELPDCDIVALQEVWEPHRTKLLDQLCSAGAKWHVILPEDRSDEFSKSGLVLLTSLDVLKWKPHRYKAEAGEDALKNKGALLARLRAEDGRELDVVVTHLQADPILGPWRGSATRRKQLCELIAFVESSREEFARELESNHQPPLLIVGDFNINGPLPQQEEGPWKQYVKMVEILSDRSRCYDVLYEWWCAREQNGEFTYDGRWNIWNAMLGLYFFAPRKRIDFVFYQPGDDKLVFQHAGIRSLRDSSDRSKRLSDHDGVEIIFRFD